ncbi:MAG: DMT family transporter [Candidatus Altiarchaeota archaeon]|nr:DMT family transporter [Candidatus Altiarchaeota archaeon]
MREGYSFVMLAAVFYGFISVGCQFFKELGFSLYEIAFYTFLSGSLFMSSVLLLRRQYMIQKGMFLFFLGYGLIGCLLQLSCFGAIVLGVPIAVAVLLLYTEPLWTVLFAKPFLGEPVTRDKLSAILLSFVGVFIVVDPRLFGGVAGNFGLFLALLSGVFLSLWVIYSRESELHKQHHFTTTFASMVFPLFWLLLFFPVLSFFVNDSSIIGFSLGFPLMYPVFFFLYVFVAFIIPDTLFYTGLDFVSASRAGVIMPLEPISATLLACVFFQQPITLNIVAGGALILLSNYLIVRK